MFGTAVITLFAAVLAGFASASPITRPETTTCRFTGCPTYELSPRMYMLGGSEIIASPAIECHYGYHGAFNPFIARSGHTLIALVLQPPSPLSMRRLPTRAQSRLRTPTRGTGT